MISASPFLTPLAGVLLAAALIPPLLLLYVLRLRRRPARIASTLLWTRAVEDLQANAPFQRLRPSVLLLLQVLALLAIAAAVAQPRIRGGAVDRARVVFFVDCSASMRVADAPGGLTRLDEAKRRIRDRIGTITGARLMRGSDAEVMIVAFSDRAEVVSRFTRSRAELLEAVDRIRPTDGVSRIADAFRLARAYSTNVDPDSDRPVDDPAAWELFSDGRIEDLGGEVLRGETLVYHRIGETESVNAGLLSLAVERSQDRPTQVEIFASIISWSASPRDVDVQLSVDGAALALRPVALPPAVTDGATGGLVPGRASVVFTPFEETRGAVIEVAVVTPDVLAADNRQVVVLPPPRPLSVALVGPPRSLVRPVLEGLPLQELILLTPERFAAIADPAAPAAGTALERFDVIVLDNVTIEELPPGRYLSFGTPPGGTGLREDGEPGPDLVLSANRRHPLLRYVDFDPLEISRTRPIRAADAVEVLAEGGRGPLIVLMSRGTTRVVHVAFEPAASTWPILRSFVSFIFNAVDYLGHSGSGVTDRPLAPGDAIATRLPAAATDIDIIEPDGHRQRLEVRDPALLSWGPARQAGLHLLEWTVPDAPGRQQRAFAVNLSDESESRTQAAEIVEIGGSQVGGDSGAALIYTSLWPYAVVFALLVLMLEWWLWQRRVRV